MTFFQFAGRRDGKVRPGAVVSGEAFAAERGDMVLASISSKAPRDEFDVPLAGWEEIGLVIPSKVRVGQFRTIPRSGTYMLIGRIGGGELADVRERIAAVFE